MSPLFHFGSVCILEELLVLLKKLDIVPTAAQQYQIPSENYMESEKQNQQNKTRLFTFLFWVAKVKDKLEFYQELTVLLSIP